MGRKRDFGTGVYLTTKLKQAKQKAGKNGAVYQFDVDFGFEPAVIVYVKVFVTGFETPETVLCKVTMLFVPVYVAVVANTPATGMIVVAARAIADTPAANESFFISPFLLVFYDILLQQSFLSQAHP